jgi:hypothetical protein
MSAHDRGDLVVRNGEHVVQNEREPLGGIQQIEHDQQGQADRVSQNGRVLGVDPLGAADNRVGNIHAHDVDGPRPARPEHVQTHPRHDRRQPATEVADAARVGPVEA